MTKTLSQPAKSKKQNVVNRQFEGEKESRPLLYFLNPRDDRRLMETGNVVAWKGPRHKHGVACDAILYEPGSNIAKLVRAFKRLDSLARECSSFLPHERQHTRLTRHAKRITEILNAASDRYAFTERVAVKESLFSGVRGSGEPLTETATWQEDDFYKWVQCSDRIPFDLQEATAFFALKEIVKRRWFWRLRLCTECGVIWLWAKKKTQERCSAKCVKAYSRRKRKPNEAYARKFGK